MSYLGQQLGQGQAERFVFTASGGETSVTTSDDGRAVAYTVGQVDVYLNGAKLINGSDFTATTGTSITGLAALTASDVVEVFALSIFQASDTVSAASGGTFNGNVTMAANLSFGDNNKAIFGAGSDLQIFHNGTDSFIREVGTGGLKIDTNGPDITLRVNATETAIVANSNGSVDLYYDNSQKLATTNTGIDVTGTVTADGLTVDAGGTLRLDAPTTTDYLAISQADAEALITANNSGAGSGALTLQTTSGGTPYNRLNISAGGDISFYEDTGTTPKFFWDASAESLGIGRTDPSYAVDAFGNAIRSGGSGTAGVDTRLIALSSGNGGSGRGVAISFQPSGSANAVEAAKIIALQESVSATANNAKLTFNVADTGGTLQERMRIDSAGNVGIGTASPSSYPVASDLVIDTGTNGGITIKSGTTNYGGLFFADGTTGNEQYRGFIQYNHNYVGSVDALLFGTAGAEAMRIDSSGNLLLGRTNPSSAAEDNGWVFYPSGYFVSAMDGTGTNAHGYFINNAAVNATVVGSISSSGSTTSYNTSSDYRLKDVDGPITNSGAYIDALKPVQGSWKADGSRFIGLIAHEVQEVSETQIATGEKDGEEMQGMDYSAPELIANLIAEIQSLRARVAQLEGA